MCTNWLQYVNVFHFYVNNTNILMDIHYTSSIRRFSLKIIASTIKANIIELGL